MSAFLHIFHISYFLLVILFRQKNAEGHCHFYYPSYEACWEHFNAYCKRFGKVFFDVKNKNLKNMCGKNPFHKITFSRTEQKPSYVNCCAKQTEKTLCIRNGFGTFFVCVRGTERMEWQQQLTEIINCKLQ